MNRMRLYSSALLAPLVIPFAALIFGLERDCCNGVVLRMAERFTASVWLVLPAYAAMALIGIPALRTCEKLGAASAWAALMAGAAAGFITMTLMVAPTPISASVAVYLGACVGGSFWLLYRR